MKPARGEPGEEAAAEKYLIEVRGIPVLVALKKIRHIYLKVSRGTGEVSISAPVSAGRAQIMEFAFSRAEWLSRQEKKKKKKVWRPPGYVTGEKHYFQGKPLRLEVIEDDSPPSARLRGSSRIELRVRKGTPAYRRKKVLEEWYRSELKKKIPLLVKNWEKRTGLKVNEWRVRRMKTRWGTCTVPDRRLWFNLELVKKPPRCLEYIAAHEVLHLEEPRHGGKHTAMLDRLMPDWRRRKEELDNFPG